MSVIYEELQDKWKARLSWHRLFFDTFGVPLLSYVSPITGFDTVKFDEVLIKPVDGQSVMDVVRSQYGDEVANMIECLVWGRAAPGSHHAV